LDEKSVNEYYKEFVDSLYPMLTSDMNRSELLKKMVEYENNLSPKDKIAFSLVKDSLPF
jgi:hypothetical protein